MSEEIPVKTLVILISGGPVMVVSSFAPQDDGLVACEWFDGGKLVRDRFDRGNLIIVKWP